jgi:hypothetical protein
VFFYKSTSWSKLFSLERERERERDWQRDSEKEGEREKLIIMVKMLLQYCGQAI